MKDAIGFAVLLLAIAGCYLLDDYRAERCIERGHRWVRETGCSVDWCDRTTRKAGK